MATDLIVRDANGDPVSVPLLPVKGQKTAAGSSPVVLNSDHDLAKAANIASMSTAIVGALSPLGGLPVVVQGNVGVGQIGSWTVDIKSGAQVAVSSLPALPAGNAKVGSVDVANADAISGSDGVSPPAISGSGVRGWLRGIYERLGSAATAAAQATSNDYLVSLLVATQSQLPATKVFDIAADPNTDLTVSTRAIRCETGGTLLVDTVGGSINVPLRFKDGETRPVQVKKVRSLGSASGVEGMA